MCPGVLGVTRPTLAAEIFISYRRHDTTEVVVRVEFFLIIDSSGRLLRSVVVFDDVDVERMPDHAS